LVHKDLDFEASDRLSKIQLGREAGKLMYDAIQSDAAFLRSRGVIDYSLLVGVHWRAEERVGSPGYGAEHAKLIGPPGAWHLGVPTVMRETGTEKRIEGTNILFMGIVDFLVPYNNRKKAENAAKTVMYGGKQDFSVIPPHKYAPRFIAAMQSRIVIDDE